jgi:hypothetical protein
MFEGNRHGKNCGRVVMNTKSGERFVETCNRHWQERSDRWLDDLHAAMALENRFPSPMPMGHRMFSDFEHYNTVLRGSVAEDGSLVLV